MEAPIQNIDIDLNSNIVLNMSLVNRASSVPPAVIPDRGQPGRLHRMHDRQVVLDDRADLHDLALQAIHSEVTVRRNAPARNGRADPAADGDAAPRTEADSAPVRPRDVDERRLHATLAAAAEAGPESFEELLLCPGLGARTLESLALVAEVVHGRPARFRDPARVSLAHGGKDGHPFPVPLKVYDTTIEIMRAAVGAALLDNADRLAALKQLDARARALEPHVSGQGVAAYLEGERRRSHHYRGMTVFGPAGPPPRRPTPVRRAPSRRRGGAQLELL